MPGKKEEFLKRLIATFRVEADEHVRAMSAGITELQQSPAGDLQAETVEHMFREAHSLKGAARAVNFTGIESVCQSIENVFARLKDGSLSFSSPLSDLMLEAVDDLTRLLSSDTAGMAGAGDQAITKLTRRLDDAARGVLPAARVRSEPKSSSAPAAEAVPAEQPTTPAARAEPTEPPPVRPAASADTVRVSTAKLNRVMRQTEELLLAKLAAEQRIADLREAETVLTERKKSHNAIRSLLRPGLLAEGNGKSASHRKELAGLLEYLDTEQLFLRSLEGRIDSMRSVTAHDHRSLSGTVDGLLQDVREMLMLPFTSLLETFPYVVRELARDRGKEVELKLQGGDIEIDRRILEEMKDPFIHLLRNCVDHGIETPEVRREQNKPAAGSLAISVTQADSGKVAITISDDGAGIDAEKVAAAARKLGLVPAEESGRMSQHDLLQMIFRSGVSTSPIISDISGRGLGLAIVREKVERLGGAIAIESQAGTGTTFRIVVPLTLATFRGVLVRSAGQIYAIPLHNVDCVVRTPTGNVRTVENRETITVDGETVALVKLGAVLELGATENHANGHVLAVLINSGFDRIAFQVEEVVGEQEVLVKMLGRQLERVRNVSGAGVLGTGQVVPVLNVVDLMKSALQIEPLGSAAAAPTQQVGGRQYSVLVAEDSITSRALLKNILESAGYQVVTAVDGVDAYTALRTGEFDLVVSDVDMPRMNGFDLTAKIRADKQWSELPVVLVTSLGSREHRERGIDVGANAYIVKSSFDQSNLLEVIERLV